MLALVAACLIACQPLPRTVEAGPAAFEFRSGMWINLHHVLWAHAFVEPAPGAAWLVDLPADAQPAWDEAVSRYKSIFEGRRLMGDRDLMRIDIFLSETGDDPLPDLMNEWPDVRDALTAIEPVYRTHAWPAHREAILERLSLYDALPEHGALVAQDFTRLYDEPWPEGVIVVELLSYANWATAYTSYTRDGGLIRIGPSDSVTPDPDPDVTRAIERADALETLWHEATHLLVHPRQSIGAMIADAGEAQSVTPPRDLWHVIIFEGGWRTLDRRGVFPDGYTPYPERVGLYDDSPTWALCRDAVVAHWPAYLDGEITLQAAIDAIVRDASE